MLRPLADDDQGLLAHQHRKPTTRGSHARHPENVEPERSVNESARAGDASADTNLTAMTAEAGA